MEIATAVLLSLAALGSAWSGGQSVLWSGIQTFHLADVDRMERRVSNQSLVNGQKQAMAATFVERYMEAVSSGNNKLANFLLSRFPPDLREATKKWMETRPLENPSAPLVPFVMEGYIDSAANELMAERKRAEEAYRLAQEANTVSDRYTQLGMLFSLGLFFGGVTAMLRKRSLRNIALALGALAVFIGGFVLFTLPRAG
jgi:hypothetical protein